MCQPSFSLGVSVNFWFLLRFATCVHGWFHATVPPGDSNICCWQSSAAPPPPPFLLLCFACIPASLVALLPLHRSTSSIVLEGRRQGKKRLLHTQREKIAGSAAQAQARHSHRTQRSSRLLTESQAHTHTLAAVRRTPARPPLLPSDSSLLCFPRYRSHYRHYTVLARLSWLHPPPNPIPAYVCVCGCLPLLSLCHPIPTAHEGRRLGQLTLPSHSIFGHIRRGKGAPELCALSSPLPTPLSLSVAVSHPCLFFTHTHTH